MPRDPTKPIAARSPRLSFWEVFTKYPPWYVRLMAKKDARTSLSETQIAIASGLSLNRIREIVRLDDWNPVTFGEIVAFTTACNFDPTNWNDRHRVWHYEYTCQNRNQTPFRFLRKCPHWESEILPIIRRLKSSPTSLAA